jgi:hypothetical protein
MSEQQPKPMHQPAAPRRASSKKQPEKLLSREEQEACMERLYARSMEDAKRKEEKRQRELASPPGRKVAKKITSSEAESLTQRMYEKQIEHQRLKREQNEKKKEKEISAGMQSKKALTEEELADSVSRMYTQARDIKEKNLVRLEKKFHGAQSESKKLTKEEVKACGERLASGWKEKKQQARDRIFQRDYAQLDPKRTTITPEETQAMAARLCTTKTGGH